MVTNDTTTISVDYLRLLAAGFERSLAVENLPPFEWTEALQKEHSYVVDRIRDHPIPGPSRSPHQKSNGYTRGIGRQDHYEQFDRYRCRPQYQLMGERSKVHTCYTCCSTADYETASDRPLSAGSAIEKRTSSCRHMATEFDDVVRQVINILRQPPGQFPLLEDLAAQSLLDSLQTLIDHPLLEERFRGTILFALLRVPRRSNIFPSNFSFDHIRLDGQLPVSSGGFADIYKAWWPHDDRAVCLKVYRKVGASSKTGLNRIANREAFIWKHLSHGNVVPFYGIHQFGDSRVALVLPWIKHGHINHFLALNPDADRSLLVSDVAGGLSYLHQNNIVHGDLKGTNILVTDTHQACLTDFGLSSIADIRGFTTLGGGAIRWQAPELLGEVEAHKTQASDVYAFAMSCYEIFTGRRPFPEVVRDLTVITKVLAGERLSRPSQSFELDDEMWSLIESCWNHDPRRRLTAAQIYRQLNPKIGNRRRRPSAEDILIRQFMSSGSLARGPGPSSAETLMALENIIQEIISLKEVDPGRLHTPVLFITTPEKENARPTNGRASVHRKQTTKGRPLDQLDANSTDVDQHTRDAPLGPVTDRIGKSTLPLTFDTRYDSKPHDADPGFSNIISKLKRIFENIDQYKLFLNCSRTHFQSQSLLDLFQQLLDSTTLKPQFRHNLVIATQRLAKATNLYPKCFALEDMGLTVGDQPVAAGGFADIHKGRIKDKSVCLKVIRLYQVSQVDYVLKRFYQEAILWGQLSHPNLLPFYGLYRFRNRLCLVSPWVENGDINNYLERNLHANRALLALDVATGISYLHANDIIHGDLKGPNILVDDSGRGRLADFGLSAVTDPKILKWTSQSSAASKGGSIRWQAPELFGAESDELVPNSKASDIYAWACVCYEIFTGSVPFFEFGRDSTVMFKVGLGKRPSRPCETSPSWVEWGLTEDIWSLKQDCWNDNPTQRPSADAITARLSSTSVNDTRPIESWEVSSPVQLQDVVGRRYPSIDALDAMLWGVPTLGGSVYQ